jgi:hypothetical protein
MTLTRRAALIGLMLAVPFRASAAPIAVTLYKDPQCTCCAAYADYLKAQGFAVEIKPTDDLATINRKAGIAEDYAGCHTAFFEGYVVSGHVPIDAIRKLLAERPAIAGITLPGMPMGSPGMGGEKTEPFVIYVVGKDGSAPTVFATL